MEENVKFDKKSLKLVQGKTADFGEIAKDCVAFANTYGGYLAIGIEETRICLMHNKPFPRIFLKK